MTSKTAADRRRLRRLGYPIGVLVALITSVLTYGTIRENGGGLWTAGLASFGVLCVLGATIPVVVESEC